MKLPKLVAIQFYDHCMGDANVKPIPCEVLGLLHKEDDLAYYVASWIADKVIDHNTEQFVILKSTVIKVLKVRTFK